MKNGKTVGFEGGRWLLKSYSQIQNQSRRNWTNNKDNSESARKGQEEKGCQSDHEHRIVPEKDAEGNVINF